MAQEDQEKNQTQGSAESFEDLIQKKFEAERQLEEKFTRELTLLCTDVKGSTEMQRTKGDLAVVAILSVHNRILEPILKKYGGRIINMTDGAFVAFDSGPEEAVKAAIEFMRELHEYNANTRNQVNIRIALHHGPVIEKGEKELDGLTVSTTARVEQAMKAFEQKNKEIGKTPLIFSSQSVYEKVRNSEDIICRWADRVEAKGLDKPMDLFRVIWNPEMEQAVPAPALAGRQTRGLGISQAEIRGEAPTEKRNSFVIEISKEKNKIKVSGYEKSGPEQKTVRHYEDRDVDQKKLEKYNAEIVNLLNRATHPGNISKEILNKLKATGQVLYDELLTKNIKEKLAATKAKDLILNIDDHLVQIPWELLYDGTSFLSLRFNMGRVVSTKQNVSEGAPRPVSAPLKMLVLSDPRNNLKSAAKEGILIRNRMEAISGPINVNVKTGHIKSSYVLEKIRNFDIVHYAGHSDYDGDNPSQSGWLLDDGKLVAEEFKKMAGSQPMPALVFSNGCHSGQTAEWKIPDNCEERIYGMANAFLLTGVRHYIGTFWEILDEPSSHFSLTFYENLSRNKSVGESVREARKALIKKYGEETIVWASYMLYGDPTFTYVPTTDPMQIVDAHEEKKDTGMERMMMADSSRSEDAVEAPAAPPQKSGGLGYALGGLVVLLLIGIGAFFFRQTQQTEQLASSVRKAQNTMAQQQARQEASVKQERQTEEKRLLAEEKKEGQQKVAALVTDLAKRYREGKEGTAKPEVVDEWTSRPLVVSIFPLKNSGQNSAVSPDDVATHLTEALERAGRVRLVDRELLESLLRELRLSSSDLADNQTALRIGRLVGARFIATGSIFTLGEDIKVSLRLLETETTSIVMSASDSGKGAASLPEITAALSEKMEKALVAAFPLRGEILGFAEDKVMVNIGKDHGVEKGVKFNVFQEKPIEGADGKMKVKAGKVEITDIDDRTAMGVVLEKKGEWEKGRKVEELK